MEMNKTREMVLAEVGNLIDIEWNKIIYAYTNNCYEIGVSIKVNMSGNMEKIEVVTALEYYPLPKTKVKNDPVIVNEKQISLPLKKVG